MKPAAVLLLFAALAASACNTVQGAGKDLSTAGDAVSKEAQETKSQM